MMIRVKNIGIHTNDNKYALNNRALKYMRQH